MGAHKAQTVFMAALAVAGGILLSAASAPVRLLGVSANGNAVLIEATEPVPYSVSRPDPLTVLVDLRNVTVTGADNRVERSGAIAGVTLEQATGADGRSIGRVRVSLARPVEYTVRSARNTIRLELAQAAYAAAVKVQSSDLDKPAATVLERVRASRAANVTTVTLSGNGRLAPASVSESQDEPRRLVLDFPNVAAKAAARTAGDGSLVRQVRVGLNSREPLVTRVVMEIADGVTYHVDRAGDAGRDLAIVFEPAQAPGTIMVAPPDAAVQPADPEPDIPVQQAMANAAAIAPSDSAADPMTALKSVAPAPAARPQSAPASPPAEQNPPPRPPPAQAPPAQAPPPAAPPAPSAVGPHPVQAPPQQTSTISTVQEKKYVGHPISLDYQGADLRAVLRAFAEISGLNIIIDPDVQGSVDIILNDVPWDQALEVILRGNGLDYTVDGTIVRIAKIDTLRKEQDQRQQLARAAADAGVLSVRTYSLSYAKATTVAPLVKKSVLSSRGDVQTDDRTNTLIITDLAPRLDTVGQLLQTLDRPEPQVEIEARIISTTREFARTIGVRWGFTGRMTQDLGNTTNLAFPNSGTLSGGVNAPASAATSAVSLALGAVNGSFNLDIALSALESSGKGRILSTPRVTTQNNVEAEVTQGIQIPVQTVANNTVTVTFKDAALTMKVTPQITAANTVIMQISVENATPGTPVQNIPSINTQRAITRVQVGDGMTTVIGGIFISQEQNTRERTPVLHRIPLLGWLFRRDADTDQSRELLIFITPRILKG